MSTLKPKKELPGSRVRIRFRKHILPPFVGFLVFVLVFGFFNSEWISAKLYYLYSSRHVSASNLDTATAHSPIPKNAPPEIIVNKINVMAPVIYDQTVVNETAFLRALHNGVVHYPDTAFPGQQGNVVIFGHSSGLWWAPGNYKFVFTLLDKLTYGDKIFLDYGGVRYIYSVTNSFVVAPTDLSVLDQGGAHMLTLLTCTPVGTSTNRLVIQAQQISPKLPAATAYNLPAALPRDAQGTLPSNSDSLWGTLRGIF